MHKQVLRQVRERPPSTAPTTPATPTAPTTTTTTTTTTTDPEPDDVRAAGEPRPKSFRQLPLRFDDRVREWQAPVALDWPGKQAPMRATVLSEYFHVT